MGWFEFGFTIGIIISVVYCLGLVFSKSFRLSLADSFFNNTYYGMALQLFSGDKSIDEDEVFGAYFIFFFATIGLIILFIVVFTMLGYTSLVSLIPAIGAYVLYLKYTKSKS